MPMIYALVDSIDTDFFKMQLLFTTYNTTAALRNCRASFLACYYQRQR